MKFVHILTIFLIVASIIGVNLVFLTFPVKAQVTICPNPEQNSCIWCTMVYNCPSAAACGNDCYYGLLGCYAFHCGYCYKDSAKPPAGPYIKNDWCYYGDVACLTTGWQKHFAFSICGLDKKSSGCTSNGATTPTCSKGHCGAECSYPTNDCNYKGSTSICNADCTCTYGGIITSTTTTSTTSSTTTTILPCNMIDTSSAKNLCVNVCKLYNYRYVYCQCNTGQSTCDPNRYSCSNSATNGIWPTYYCGVITTTTTTRTTTTTIYKVPSSTTTTIRSGGGGGGGGRKLNLDITSIATITVVIAAIVLVTIFGAFQFFAKKK